MPETPAKLLIVDDHSTNRLKLSMAVRALGHVAEQAENGRVALEKMRAEAFDLVLLDIVMPEMTGHEVLEVMRGDPELRMLPVIVVSGSNEVADAIECIQRGAEDYLAKPFDPVLLRARIGASLTKKRLNDEVRQQMTFIRDILGKYIPDTVAKQVVDGGGNLEPARTMASILITDVVGFTGIVESHPPEPLFEMLNAYFRAILDPITRHGGIINHFAGDAVMALFNVPIPDPDHADHAMQAALEIHEITEATLFSGVKFQTRMGINTGEVIAGNVGDGSRLTYTVHGSAVNMAARLEQLNKDHGSLIMISDGTADQLKESYPLRDAGTVTLRGLSDPVGIKIYDPA